MSAEAAGTGTAGGQLAAGSGQQTGDGAAPTTGAGVPWRRYALGAAGAMFTGMGIGRFSYTTMVPALVKAGALDGVEAGRVGMVNLGGFLIGAIVSVPLARALGRRRSVLAALIVCLVMLALSAAPLGGVWLAGCRGVIGITTGLMMVLSLALVAETAPADRRAEASGYMFAGVGLGILSSAVLVPLLIEAELSVLWSVLAAASVLGASLAAWGWWRAPEPPGAMAAPGGSVAGAKRPAWTRWTKWTGWSGRARGMSPRAESPSSAGPLLPSSGLKLLLVAHLLFSVGLVPHTLYWVDYLRRGLGLGPTDVALNWGLVGLFSFLGPMLASVLARRIGTRAALVLAFVLVGSGLAAPLLIGAVGSAGAPGATPMPATALPLSLASLTGLILIASSVLFGAQPGLSSLMAARTRDLGQPEQMGRIMRAMILANACGGVLGGLVVPWAYGLGWSQPALFVIGGAAMGLAAVAASPAAGARDAAAVGPAARG